MWTRLNPQNSISQGPNYPEPHKCTLLFLYMTRGAERRTFLSILPNSSYKETFSKWVMLQGLSNTALLSWLLPVAFFHVYTAKECEVLQRQDMWTSKKASTLVFHLHLQLQRFGWWISNPPQHGREAKRKAVMEQLGAFTLILHNYTGSFDDLLNSIKKSSFYRHLSQVPTPG